MTGVGVEPVDALDAKVLLGIGCCSVVPKAAKLLQATHVGVVTKGV